jgi:hypothetical protein
LLPKVNGRSIFDRMDRRYRLRSADVSEPTVKIIGAGPGWRRRRNSSISALPQSCSSGPIVDKEVIDAIKGRRIGIVAGLESFGERDVTLVDRTRLRPDLVVAATGYSRGLQPLVGHIGVLDRGGAPRVHGGSPAAPGLWFVGFEPRPGQIGHMGREARRVARAIVSEISSGDSAAANRVDRH